MDAIKDNFISFLRWSEKYTKTDMVYLTTGTWWLGISQIASSVIAFSLTIILANLLSPEVFGEYRFLMSGILILSIFSLPGIKIALLESTPKGFVNNLRIAFKEAVKWSILGSFVSIIISIYYYLVGDNSLAISFAIIAILLPLFETSTLYIDYLKSLKQFKSVAIYNLITKGLLLPSVIAVSLIFPQFSWIIFTIFLLGNILPNLFFHKRVLKKYTSETGRTDPNLINYSKHITAIAFLTMLSSQFDKIFIWNNLGPESLAIFYIAYAIPQEMNRFFEIIQTLAFPKFAKKDISILKKTLPPKLIKYFILTLFLVVIYIMAAPYIFKFLFPTYIEAIKYSQILALGTLSTSLSPILTYFIVNKMTRILYITSIIIPTVRILSTIILILFFGLWGAVYAILIEGIVKIICLIYFFNKAS